MSKVNQAKLFIQELVSTVGRELIEDQYDQDYIAYDKSVGAVTKNYPDGLTRKHFTDNKMLVACYVTFYAISDEARNRGLRAYPQKLRYLNDSDHTLFDFIHRQIKDDSPVDSKRLARELSELLMTDWDLIARPTDIEARIIEIAWKHGIPINGHFTK